MVVKPLISGHGFEVGDMVWVKMKSQPWWPGHVYSEEFATPLVRRSKREGLLLVALFGASSYGWFNYSELVPFDSNYAEKCQQTDSRMFIRAVEDAMVEVNRRIGLGLSCMCHNKQNFREIDVQGFVVVDVAGYGAVYSMAAIGKARDGFQPNLVIDFLRQLALEPASSEHVDDIEFIKNKASVLSYRKAVYEDFDEPAPQAASSKAPLSGMEVFADSLGKVKNTAKRKERDKKDDYIFKRRDDKEIKKEKEKVASSLLPASFEHSTSASCEFSLKDATGIDQAKVKSADDEKRIVQEVEGQKVISQDAFPKEPGSGKTVISENEEDRISLAEMFLAKKTSQHAGFPKSDGNNETDLARVLYDLHALAVDPCNTFNTGSCTKGKKVFLRFRSLVFKKSKNFSLPLANGEPNTRKSSQDNVQVLPVIPPSGPKRGLSDLQEEMIVKKKKVGNIKQPVATTLKKPGPVAKPTMLILKFPQGGYLPSFNELKARFACYGPMDHSATQILKNTFSCEVVFRHKAHAQAACRFVVESSSLFGNTGVKCTLKDVGDMGATEPEPPVKVPKDHHQQPAMEVRPPSMVPAISGVQVKSVLKTSGGEVAAGKGGRETDLLRVLEDLLSLAVDPFNKVNRGSRVKGKKAFLRFRSLVFQKSQNFSQPLAVGEPNASKDSVEPQRAKLPSGPKRGPPDCQEEMAAAKKKKVTKVIDEPPARDVKQPVKKPGPELTKKTGPTMLTLKFPQGGSLPSYNELKARFTRYGPMDHSATHIFWNRFSCQVLFRHGAHAMAAHRFVVGSSSVFGNTGVKCTLKEVEVGTVSSAKSEPPVDKSNRPLKSILKKSGGEEAAGGGGRGRVKFMMGGDESQMKNKSGGTFSSKNIEKGVHPSVVTGQSTPLPPQPPPCVRLALPPLPPVTSHSVQMTPLPLMAPNIDIEKQMLSLLTSCNDVVTNVRSILGYMPYHPL